MHRALLFLSALILPAAAANAQISGTPRQPMPGLSGSPVSHDFCRNDFRGNDGRHHRHRRGGDGCRTDVVMDWYGGEWALYNNRSWEPDSYNDWWHDRPERSYPRWMSHNQDCARRWYSGDVLSC